MGEGVHGNVLAMQIREFSNRLLPLSFSPVLARPIGTSCLSCYALEATLTGLIQHQGESHRRKKKRRQYTWFSCYPAATANRKRTYVKASRSVFHIQMNVRLSFTLDGAKVGDFYQYEKQDGSHYFPLIQVPEVRVLPVCQVLKGMQIPLVLGLLDACCGYRISLRILATQVPPQEADGEKQ